MWMILDGIILAIIALCTFLGYKKGLIGVIFKIVSFFIAIIVAIILSIPISNWIINNTKLATSMQQAITDKLIEEDTEEKTVEKSDINHAPQAIVDYINKQVTDAKNEGIQAAAEQISITVVRVLVVVVLYIVTRIILIFCKAIANTLAEIPLIKQFNKLGGTLYGILEGLLIVFVGLAILSLIAPMVNQSGLFELIDASIITSFLYNHNIILQILI